MLKKLILRNAKRQLGDYVLYCITIACAVACMYAYNALLFSDAGANASKFCTF